MMHYRGYSANVEYSAEDGCFVGHIAGIRDVVGFHGGSTFELEAAFKEAVDDYLESRKWNTAVDKLDQPDNDFVRIAARRVLERSEW